ncbi:MAG: hypothetical protein U0R28_05515 [Candidatus Nanopelagicales bacterium]
MNKTLAIVAAAGVAGASLMAAPAAQAQTVKACVKKSNGSVKIINKKFKKCKKGWVKTSWNSEGAQGVQGPQGVPGAAGPNWLVKDKSGVTLGIFSGYFSAGLVPTVMVTGEDGGVYMYSTNGTLLNTVDYFTNNGCTDAAVWGLTNGDLKPYLNAAGGSGRAVFQVTGAATASAWKIAATTTTTIPVPANSLFTKNSTTGACSAATHGAGFIVQLTPALAPVAAAPGPLQIVR